MRGIAPLSKATGTTFLQQETVVPKLSVVVPFRNDPELPHLAERLEMQCAAFPAISDIEFLVVDSGSKGDGRDQAVEICERHGVRYIYHSTEEQVFSIGAARDYGARHAKGSAVSFLDADCVVAPDFWPRLLSFMQTYGISQRKSSFFVIPCLYLTMDGTEEFLKAPQETRFQDFQLRWLNGDSEAVQNLAPCSSVMVVDRLHYLSVGGHRAEFRGHGFEDFELYHRLVAEDGRLPRPEDYYRDSKTWDTANYSGFRAMFALLGRPALLANLFVVHLWHPRPKSAGFYGPEAMKMNRDMWVDFFKDFDANGYHPAPLVDSTAVSETLLFFGQERTNPIRGMGDILPLLGKVKFIDEFDFLDEAGDFAQSDFEATLEQLGVTKLLFTNPYGNAARVAIYRWCRSTGFPLSDLRAWSSA